MSIAPHNRTGKPAGGPRHRAGHPCGAEVVELLRRDRGATIDELIDATGWLPHTTRAALTGLRKRGFALAIDRSISVDPKSKPGSDPAAAMDRPDSGVASTPTSPRGGTKIAQVIALLEGPGGATLAELVAATGLLPHTTRAALTGLRKRGYAVGIDRADKARGSVYRIEPTEMGGIARRRTLRRRRPARRRRIGLNVPRASDPVGRRDGEARKSERRRRGIVRAMARPGTAAADRRPNPSDRRHCYPLAANRSSASGLASPSRGQETELCGLRLAGDFRRRTRGTRSRRSLERPIPHADLLKSAARRIVDRHVLHLIKMWLDCPVEETDDRGRKTRTTGARDKRRGIPQGSPLSPLLANIYMRRFVLGSEPSARGSSSTPTTS